MGALNFSSIFSRHPRAQTMVDLDSYEDEIVNRLEFEFEPDFIYVFVLCIGEL